MAEESNAMYYSVDNLNHLSSELATKCKEFSEIIDTMYTEIYGMESNNYWRGATYTQFKTMCDNFKNNKITVIIDKIRGWSRGFAEIATSAADNTAKNVSKFEDDL